MSGDVGLLYGVDSYGYSYEIERQPKKPWKKIALAVALLLAGSVLLSIGLVWTLAWSSHPDAHGITLMSIGSFLFIPGFYYSRIAYYAYQGYKGFDLDDIPEVE